MSRNSHCADRKHDARIPAELAAPVMMGAVAILAMSVMIAIMMTGGVAAQTLTAPDAHTNLPPPPPGNSHERERAKACSNFGAGFVQLPGTDACVKIGGFVTVEGSGHGN